MEAYLLSDEFIGLTSLSTTTKCNMSYQIRNMEKDIYRFLQNP